MRAMSELLAAPAVIMSLLTCVSAARAGVDARYPIWWSPGLELESRDKIDERLMNNIGPIKKAEHPSPRAWIPMANAHLSTAAHLISS